MEGTCGFPESGFLFPGPVVAPVLLKDDFMVYKNLGAKQPDLLRNCEFGRCRFALAPFSCTLLFSIVPA